MGLFLQFLQGPAEAGRAAAPQCDDEVTCTGTKVGYRWH